MGKYKPSSATAWTWQGDVLIREIGNKYGRKEGERYYYFSENLVVPRIEPRHLEL
jgi:hypothetical protein